MVIAKYPQLTDGYACRVGDVDPANRAALLAAYRLAFMQATAGAPDAVKTLMDYERGEALFAKVNGAATLLPAEQGA